MPNHGILSIKKREMSEHQKNSFLNMHKNAVLGFNISLILSIRSESNKLSFVFCYIYRHLGICCHRWIVNCICTHELN